MLEHISYVRTEKELKNINPMLEHISYVRTENELNYDNGRQILKIY